MKSRIIKSEIRDRVAFIPQWKPNILVQLLQLNFDWRFFRVTTVTESDCQIRFFRTLEGAVKFIESGIWKDLFSKMVVWQDGKHSESEAGHEHGK